MTDSNSIDYYAARERKERELADTASDPAISAIHLDMAARYAELTATHPGPARIALATGA